MVNKHESTLPCFPLCGNKSPQPASQFYYSVSKHLPVAERGAEGKSNLLRELFLDVFLI